MVCFSAILALSASILHTYPENSAHALGETGVNGDAEEAIDDQHLIDLAGHSGCYC